MYIYNKRFKKSNTTLPFFFLFFFLNKESAVITLHDDT